jgi:hypothetical protein
MSLLAPLTRAFIPEPYELYGVAKLDTGVVLDDGSPIRSFVDGVDYSNKTSVFSRPGNTDGYFDIDTYGNYRTNATDPGTPWIKEGADDNEPIMYSWGDFSNNTQIGGPSQPWLQAKVFKETHDWQTGLPPQAGDLTLAPLAEQPPLLKILSLTTNSTYAPFTDYVWLCNPTNQNVDASQFYLQKDVLGNVNGPQVQVTAGTIGPYKKYFVDTGSLNYFNEAGDNLKLVWKNTASPTAAFGGNDIVLDRVEFNKTPAGGALNWEPGNTIMNNEPAPDRGFQINRSSTCRDTNSVQRDFFVEVETRLNFPPTAPDPVCIEGLCSNSVDSRLFHLTKLTNFRINWTHHDPDGDPQTQANIRISTGSGGVGVIWNGNVVGATAFIDYTGLPLLKGNNYCFSVQTKDPYPVFGAWGELCFRTNGLPAPVNKLWPSNGWQTSPKLDQHVYWALATDPDPGDSLNYTWKVNTTANMGTPLYSGTTALNTSAPFLVNPTSTYFWCVNASDGWEWLNGCGSTWQFTTSTPPPAPTATDLEVDGHAFADAYLQHVTNRVPVFTWTFNPTTGRTQTAFHIQVYRQTGPLLMWELNNTGAGGDLSTATYNSDSTGTALVNGTWYYFQVKVRDSLSPQLWSIDWGTPLDFYINTPPPTPTPLAPADDSARLVGSTILYWSTEIDADTGDVVTYDYCIDSANDPPYTTCNIAHLTATVNISAAFTTVANNYIWAVRAYDSYEYSAWSTIWNFTAYAVPPNTAPTITITAPTAGERLKQGSTYTITWTMSDNQTPNSALIVILTYRVGTGLALPIALGLTGQTSYQWTVPANVESTAVTIIAVVTDTGFLTGTNTSPQFEIYKDVQEGFPLMTVLLIVIIIVVVLAVVLVLLMKRKKPKEEEEAAAPPAAEEEPPAEEEEMAEEEAPAPPPKAAPKPVAAPMAAKPPAKAPTKTKECPSCGTIVSVTDKECFMCGAKL